MKLETVISKKIPKNLLFSNRIGGYSLFGDGRANTKIPLLVPNKNALSQSLDKFLECVEVVPIGYRERDSHHPEQAMGSKKAKWRPAFERQLGMFCLIINTSETNPECMFGLLSLEVAEIPMLTQIAHLCDGDHTFSFANVELEKDLKLSPATLFVRKDAQLRFDYERVCNLDRTKGTLALWTVLSRRQLYQDAIFIRGERKPSPLTKEQYQALVTFVRLFSTIEYSLDFYGFTPVLEDHQKVMEDLATVDHPTIKEWFEQYINELLLHEMAEVRTIMKYYVDATSKGE